MVQLSEGRLRLTFAAGWQALKFDDTAWHRQRFGHHQAMDILAVHGDQHWWIEIKDCEGFEQDNRPRMSPGDPQAVVQTRAWLRSQGLAQQVRAARSKPFIIDEVIEKLRSTLVSVLAAQRQGEAELQPYVAACNQGVPLNVVLLLTWNITDFRRLAQRLQQKLNSALLPYGLQGLVVNTPPVGLGCQVSRI
ncbi:hypothetical protein [Azotobacter beijerinckii]|uniref:Uncharacterized protein n=1 Tax=Azotobacter beijerinckii TaxID=170623 RepID=A0A1I4F4A7_9GAMM|nr:hypothetical protein [Azotobacter beijerinckii]SFL11221.1 hypothetical protein SAMN04244574_03157 [Azotobacter beijerinckii]